MEFALRSSKIVPWNVQFRVGFLILAGALALLIPQWLEWPFNWGFAYQSIFVFVVTYIVWCFWPRLTLGIPDSLMEPVPAPATQHFCLSFDDGPTPGFTDAVLDILAKHKIKATFFVLMHKARSSPALLRRMVSEGHTVGLHGEDHRSPFFRSGAAITADLSAARAELAKLCGRPVTLYRPSHGWKNIALVKAVQACGLKLCFWDYGVWDTDAPASERLLRRLRIASAPSKGLRPVVLLHDGRGDETTATPHQAALLTALPLWLEGNR